MSNGRQYSLALSMSPLSQASRMLHPTMKGIMSQLSLASARARSSGYTYDEHAESVGSEAQAGKSPDSLLLTKALAREPAPVWWLTLSCLRVPVLM